MVKAARSADVHKIVALSSIGTGLEPLAIIGAGLAAREQALRAVRGSTAPTCGPTA